MAAAIRPLVARKKEAESRRNLGSASSESAGSSSEGADAAAAAALRASAQPVHGKPFPLWLATALQIIGYVFGHMLSFIVTLGPLIGLLALYAYTSFGMVIVSRRQGWFGGACTHPACAALALRWRCACAGLGLLACSPARPPPAPLPCSPKQTAGAVNDARPGAGH